MKHQVNSHKSAEDCGKGHASVAFTYDRYGHLLPEVDKQAASKLEALRSARLD
jgi:hypothetical protein